MKKFISGWYLVYTKPCFENKVANQLSEAGINFLLPRTSLLRQWHDRKKILLTPLFPSYIFVRITSHADYYNCTKANGFCYFVKFGNELAVISQKIIDDIALIVNNGTTVEVPTESLEAGRKMVINDGPLCGLSCEVVKYNGKQKVCVRVNLLNRSIIADIPHALLQVNMPANLIRL